jgi:hypothetical protein
MPMSGAFISRRGGALEAEPDNLIVTEHLLPYSEL